MPRTERGSRDSDNAVIEKMKSTKKSTAISVRQTSKLRTSLANAQAFVESYLGKYRDRYIILNKYQEIEEYLQKCVDNGVIAIDTETTGLDPMLDDIAGICIYTPGQKGAYIPINHVDYETLERLPDQVSVEFARHAFRDLLNSHVDIIMFNADFDIRVLRNQIGLKDIYCTWDCYIAAKMMNENEPSNALKKLHQKYVLKGAEDEFTFEELFKGIPFTHVPLETGYLYAARDPEITYELYEFQKKYLYYEKDCLLSDRNGMNGASWVFFNIEMPCVNIVADMEDTGVLLDMDYTKKLSEQYSKNLEDRLAKFDEELESYSEAIEKFKADHPDEKLDNPINVSSPKQLATLLYDILKLKSPDPKNPRGTGVEVLSQINHPVCKTILDYRETKKLLSTYIDKLPECVNPNDGRVHGRFNQVGTHTGRFSSSDPNLQNIPSKNKDIRKMFSASPGYVMMSSDYSQQEPKIMTQLCQDEKMIQAYKDGKDLYAEIASLSFNRSYRDCLEFETNEDGSWKLDDHGERITYPEGKSYRTQAKSILLGVLYGRGVPSIAEQLFGTPKNKEEEKAFNKKAQAVKDSVLNGFPAIADFEESSKKMGKELGYVTTLWGRKRRLPDLQLPMYEFYWTDSDEEVDMDTINKWWDKLDDCRSLSEKQSVKSKAKKAGLTIIENSMKIASAQRQCVNSRIQGSAADMTKLAMISIGNNKRLKELGFRLLIQVHDELIGECPRENAKECKELFATLMSQAASSKIEVPVKCDVEVTEQWYGKEVKID